ncbi:VOC family protein [Streptomyces sp. NPDC101733]|uniref:VOC family protein n=1 Tax=unclassified Streptomyces TaxID=2593676 RepID=UPI0038102498
MIAELQCVVLDCPEPLRLAAFYADLLGGEVDRPDPRWSVDGEWVTLHLPSGQVLAFQAVPGHLAPTWPDPRRPQQFHLDLTVPDLDRGQEEVLARGAVLLEQGPPGRDWRVFADPAGHPFCLVRG